MAQYRQHKAEEIAQLSAENKRLSNRIAQASGPQPLTSEQLSELLRLRGQIGPLREAAKEKDQLEAANQQLLRAQTGSEKVLAAARAAPNFWPKDQLAFAGYADPEATLKTALWAMNNGDMKAFLACTVAGPQMIAQLEKQPRAESEATMVAEAKEASESLVPSIGFHILDKQVKSADEVVLNLSFDGEGKARRFVMRRKATEWKLDRMLRPGEEP